MSTDKINLQEEYTNASEKEEKDTLVKTTAETVIRLTVELSPTHAAELAGLLGNHVSFFDFPWAQSIYRALVRAGTRVEDVFRAAAFESAFLLRK